MFTAIRSAITVLDRELHADLAPRMRIPRTREDAGHVYINLAEGCLDYSFPLSPFHRPNLKNVTIWLWLPKVTLLPLPSKPGVCPSCWIFCNISLNSFSGHCRPLITLAARFVKLRPVHVTFLTTNLFYDKVQAELARNFEPGEDALASRVRYVLSPVTLARAARGCTNG